MQVLKASGKLFESGVRVSLRLTVASLTRQTTARKHPLLDRRKPIAWEDESFAFPIVAHTDGLHVTCHRDEPEQEQLGQATIHLNHLPQGTNVVKWYTAQHHTDMHRTALALCPPSLTHPPRLL